MAAPDAEDDNELLCIVIDANPLAWAHATFKLEETIEALLAFLNAFTMLRHQNRVAVFASHLTQSLMLSPKHDDASGVASPKAIVDGLKALIADATPGPRHEGDGGGSSTMSAAVALALCYIHRLTQNEQVNSRILVLQVSPDEPGQHIAMMNSIFTAQRMGVTIDSCTLSQSDSVFMQQASHLTDGICFKPPAPLDATPALLQHLMVVFLPSKKIRQFLRLPSSDSVDLRASCFLTKTMIDEGYVCSVCLSVFGTEEILCPTCGTRFTFRSKAGLVQDAAGSTCTGTAAAPIQL